MQVPESAELLALQPLCYARARYQPFMKTCVVTGQGEEARAPLAASLHPPLVACIAWPLARRSGSGEVAELGQINAHVIFLHGYFLFQFASCFAFLWVAEHQFCSGDFLGMGNSCFLGGCHEVFHMALLSRGGKLIAICKF